MEMAACCPLCGEEVPQRTWRNRGLLAHAASETKPLTGLPPQKNKIRRGTGGTTQAANALVVRARATHAARAIERVDH